MKWLLSFLVLVLGYAFWKSRRADAANERENLVKRQPAEEKVRGATVPMPMLACAHCGLHLPQADAHMRAGKPFCGAAHANEHANQHGAA